MKDRIIIILSVLVVGLSGFLLYETFNTEMSEVEIRAQFSDLKAEYQQMEEDLELALEDIEEGNQEILVQKKELQKLIQKNEVTEEELNTAKKMMKNLAEVVLKSYKRKASNLQGKNYTLSEEITVIQEKVRDLDAKFIEEKRISAQKDKIIEQKNQQIYKGTRLVLSNFILTGLKLRNSGKEIQTDKASRIDRIEVEFDIIPHPLTETGEKQIFIVIKKPSGETVTFENQEAGVFIYKKIRMLYSEKLSFHYQNGEERVLKFAWDNKEFDRGDYVLEVYENTKNGVVLVGKAIKTLR